MLRPENPKYLSPKIFIDIWSGHKSTFEYPVRRGNDQRSIQITIYLLQSKRKMPSLVFPAKPFHFSLSDVRLSLADVSRC
jgi:hypothetical protein